MVLRPSNIKRCELRYTFAAGCDQIRLDQRRIATSTPQSGGFGSRMIAPDDADTWFLHRSNLRTIRFCSHSHPRYLNPNVSKNRSFLTLFRVFVKAAIRFGLIFNEQSAMSGSKHNAEERSQISRLSQILSEGDMRLTAK